MHNIELSHSELKTLKTIIMSDVIDSSMDVPDYSDAIDMFFYYERAKILEMINNQIGETT